MKETNEKIFSYSNGDLVVKQVFTGLFTKAFKIKKNSSDIPDNLIAKVLNDEWYGKENKLKFRTYKKHREKIIVIKQTYFPKNEV